MKWWHWAVAAGAAYLYFTSDRADALPPSGAGGTSPGQGTPDPPPGQGTSNGQHTSPDPSPGQSATSTPGAGRGTGEVGGDGVLNSSRQHSDSHPRGYPHKPSSPEPSSPVLPFPVPGWRAGRGFDRPVSGGSNWHGALDIAAPVGTPVVAVADGRVWQAKESESSSCGHRVQISHSDPAVPFPFKATYCHLNEIYVSTGEQVSKGQQIGTVGWSGNVIPKSPKGAHLHFAMYEGNWRHPFDPQPWVGKTG